MEWSEVLNPELTPEEIICEKVPALHSDRIEQFRRFSTTALIVSVHFEDADVRYTFEISPQGSRVEKGEMIDFPQVTLKGKASKWSRAIGLAARLVEPADRQIKQYEGRVEVSESLKAGFERFDGVLSVTVVDLPDGAPLSFQAILNDYEAPPRSRKVELEVSWSTLEKLAHGEIAPVEAAKEVRLKGAIGLAMELGGYFAHELDL